MLSAFIVSVAIAVAASVSGGGPLAVPNSVSGGGPLAPMGASGAPPAPATPTAADSVSGGGPV